MSWVDIDVIAKSQTRVGGVPDKALESFKVELENQQLLARQFGVAKEKLLIKGVVNVHDMLDRIVSGIGSRTIRRLRIFGHGSNNTVQLGPFRYPPVHEGERINSLDLDKVIQIIRTGENRFDLLSESVLAKLRSHFDSRGWVELHSCRIMGGDGEVLIKKLSDLWNVPVQASDARQHVGGGLEGNIWQARPGMEPHIQRPATQGLRRFKRSAGTGLGFLGNPIGAVFDSLTPKTTGSPQMLPGTGYSSLRDRGFYMVDPLRVHRQVGAGRAFGSQFGIGATAQSIAHRNDPLQSAIDSLKPKTTGFPQMLPGTGYSSLRERKSYMVDPLGVHWQVGAGQAYGIRFGTTSRAQSSAHWNDPLGSAIDSLRPTATRFPQMLPGTGYSSLLDRKSYVVDHLGMHRQVGAMQAFGSRVGTSPTVRSFTSWNNPLKQAVRMLGG